MKIKKLFNQLKPPCSKCPYKLGEVKTTVNPCPRCKQNNYQDFEIFQTKTGHYIKEGD